MRRTLGAAAVAVGCVVLADCSSESIPAGQMNGVDGGAGSSGSTSSAGSGGPTGQGPGGSAGATGSGGSTGSAGNVGTGGASGGGSTGGGGNVGTGGGSAGSGGTAVVDAGSGGGSVADARDSSVADVVVADVGALPRFSFFVTSLEAMRRLSKSQDGFGGDLRYGEATGLAGADKICTEIAESSMPGSSGKQWRAFLSIALGPGGNPVHAIDRVGEGPWYDRRGRLVAMTKTDLAQLRPRGADPAIIEDLPNELGNPNQRPDPAQPPVNNPNTLTGSNAMGRFVSPMHTCLDWTSSSRDNTATGLPQTGFSWPKSTIAMGSWISGFRAGGCGAGVDTNGLPPDPANPIVGSGGGYGGIYCLALRP